MNEWTLATRDGFYAVHGDTMEDEVITGRPLIIDPSITFRKHFEIPESVDKSPKKLKLELFSRFLPSEIDNYICQFQEGPVTSEGSRRVLGMAIKEQDMKWLEGLHGEESEKYFLENLLRPPENHESSQGLELPLPGGVFFGIFKQGFLTWARYLGDPAEKTMEKTRDYIQEEYAELEEPSRQAEFPAQDQSQGEWITSIKEWLPANPDTSKILTRDLSEDQWEEWRATAWTLLVLAYLTIGVWIAYNYQSLQQQTSWLQNNSRKILDKTNTPATTLESKIQSLEQKLKTQSQKILNIYPRVYQLDQAIKTHNVFLLQLKLRKNQGQLVLSTDSLESAENMKSTLLEVPNIKRVEIVSTNPQQDKKYQYKVNLNMKWAPDS